MRKIFSHLLSEKSYDTWTSQNTSHPDHVCDNHLIASHVKWINALLASPISWELGHAHVTNVMHVNLRGKNVTRTNEKGKHPCSTLTVFLIFSRYFICKLVKGVRKISSYAFKMRQDYLSTRYFDQFISPSFRFAHSGDIYDPSNKCGDNPVSF